MKRKRFAFDDFEEIVREQRIRKKKKEKHEEEKQISKKKRIKMEKNEKDEINNLLKLLEKLPKAEKIGKSEIEVLISKFHHSVLKNIQMRSLYPEEPSKFLDSELELNKAIQGLHETATVPQLYPVLVQKGAINDLKMLLTHENTDISISVIHLIRELTEADAIDDNDSGSLAAFSLFEELLKKDILKLLLKNLDRLNEIFEDECQAIYAILTIFDNYSNVDEDYCLLVVKNCDLFTQLFYQMRTKKKLNENKMYCAEIMSIYVQLGGDEIKTFWANSFGIEKTLKLLTVYTDRNQLNMEEEEYFGNLGNTLTNALMVQAAKKKLAFSDRGIPVLLEFIKKKKMLKQPALKCLDMGLFQSTECCRRFVEEGGLKTIFSSFMNGKAKKRFKQTQTEIEEYLISIISNLFINLYDISYARLIKKFREKEFEKIDRLIELHIKYSTLIEFHNQSEEIRRREVKLPTESESERYERLIGQNLSTLNLIDLVTGLVATTGNKEMSERIQQVLNQQDLNSNDIKKTLKEYKSTITLENEEANKLKLILQKVIDDFP